MYASVMTRKAPCVVVVFKEPLECIRAKGLREDRKRGITEFIIAKRDRAGSSVAELAHARDEISFGGLGRAVHVGQGSAARLGVVWRIAQHDERLLLLISLEGEGEIGLFTELVQEAQSLSPYWTS